jgi:cytochrome c oxidase subunit 2
MALVIPLFPEQASTLAGRVDGLFFYLCAVSIVFSLLIGLLVITFAVRYRRRSPSDRPPQIHGSVQLETVWTAVPLVLVLVMFFWGVSVYFSYARPPAKALDIHAVGKQWMWKFQHMEGHREINELHVPVGRPVRLTMASEDVIHSFYVPAFRVKADVVPGRYNTTWFEATKTGSYHLFCAEYCGTKHSGMIGRVVVMEPADYQAWLSGQTSQVPPIVAGEELFNTLACVTCHKQERTARGPSLDGLYGSAVRLRGGEKVVADERYIRQSILNPSAKLVEGYEPIMPTFEGQISEEGLLGLVAYIKSLGGKAPPAPPALSAPPPARAPAAKAAPRSRKSRR